MNAFDAAPFNPFQIPSKSDSSTKRIYVYCSGWIDKKQFSTTVKAESLLAAEKFFGKQGAKDIHVEPITLKDLQKLVRDLF